MTNYKYYIWVKPQNNPWFRAWACDDYSLAYTCYCIFLGICPDYIKIVDSNDNVILRHSWLSDRR